MKIPPKKAKKKATASDSESDSVTLRVRRDHLKKIDAIADRMGISRSAAIKVAIAELIQSRSS